MSRQRRPGIGSTWRLRLASLPGVTLLASKKIKPRSARGPRTWHLLDLYQVRQPRVYLVIETSGKYFAQVEDFYTLGEARACWRREFKAPRMPEDVRALIFSDT